LPRLPLALFHFIPHLSFKTLDPQETSFAALMHPKPRKEKTAIPSIGVIATILAPNLYVARKQGFLYSTNAIRSRS
jgi:hypothetical protein